MFHRFYKESYELFSCTSDSLMIFPWEFNYIWVLLNKLLKGAHEPPAILR